MLDAKPFKNQDIIEKPNAISAQMALSQMVPEEVCIIQPLELFQTCRFLTIETRTSRIPSL